MANVENVEGMVGTRKAEVATESGGAVAAESGGAATRRWQRLVMRRRRPVGYCMRTKVRIQPTSAMLKRWWG